MATTDPLKLTIERVSNGGFLVVRDASPTGGTRAAFSGAGSLLEWLAEQLSPLSVTPPEETNCIEWSMDDLAAVREVFHPSLETCIEDHSSLLVAFEWRSTPQGRGHWERLHSHGNFSEEDLRFLKALQKYHGIDA